jgi:putative FmdB family regulatory protein
MPLFEYQCQKCGVRFERLQRKSDPMVVKCPECKGPVRRLIQPPGIIFKGSGFYVTDNRRSNVGSRRSEAKTSTESDSATSSGGKKESGGASNHN